jgi:FemAB-related protein (PEP-CTERM system-associated)
MIIRSFTPDDKRNWDAYVLQHPAGVAYHQCAWKEAVEHAYGFSACYLLAERAGAICGVFPLIDFKLPLFGRNLVSLPYCDIGGILADNDQASVALLDYGIKLCGDLGAKSLALRTGNAIESLPTPDIHKVSMLLDLPENSEILLAALKAKVRSQIKKPMRDGLIATLGGSELAAEFYTVFGENMRDLGSPVHSLKWIQAILASYADNARVGIVRTAAGIPVAAGIILLHDSKVSIPWASSLRRFNNLNPNMLLYWSFLAFAADNGYEVFDFGRSTAGEGTYKFKAQWGAKPQPLLWYTIDNDGVMVSTVDSSSKLRTWVELLWKKLPLPLSNFFGPIVRRCVSL